jgi:hypothetical protein
MLLLPSVTGIIWLVQSYLVAISLRKAEVELTSMQHNVFIWVPALGFSLGMDVITTGMIAGRLFYHHRRLLQKLSTGRSTPYLPALAIFIESGVLSTLSKVIQLANECYSQNPGISPCVIPLCVGTLRNSRFRYSATHRLSLQTLLFFAKHLEPTLYRW